MTLIDIDKDWKHKWEDWDDLGSSHLYRLIFLRNVVVIFRFIPVCFNSPNSQEINVSYDMWDYHRSNLILESVSLVFSEIVNLNKSHGYFLIWTKGFNEYKNDNILACIVTYFPDFLI